MINRKKLQLEYCCLQGFYWMLYCVGAGFLNAYLTGAGLQTGIVGIVSALCGTVAAVVQPFLGKLADRNPRCGWKVQLQGMLALCMGCYVLLKVLPAPGAAGLLCGLVFLLLNLMMPFVSGVGFYYEKAGIEMNFGAARGFGSLFYSVMSYFLGFWVADFGLGCISTAGIVVTLCFFVTVWRMPYLGIEGQADGGETPASEGESWGRFFRAYPKFTGMLIGFVFLMIFHSMTNTYMLQIAEAVGGGTAEMGVVLAVAGVLELPVMFAFSFLVKRFSSYHLLLLSGIGFVGKSILYLTATSVLMIYAAQVLQLISYALFASVSVYYSNEVMDRSNKLRGQALVGSSVTIGAVIGGLMGGMVIQSFSVRMMLAAGVVTAVVGAVIVCLMKQPSLKKRT